jgi:flagellar hook-length control protein FliK
LLGDSFAKLTTTPAVEAAQLAAASVATRATTGGHPPESTAASATQTQAPAAAPTPADVGVTAGAAAATAVSSAEATMAGANAGAEADALRDRSGAGASSGGTAATAGTTTPAATADAAPAVTTAASVTAGDAMTNAAALQARGEISAIAAALGGTAKHAQDAGGATVAAAGVTAPDGLSASLQLSGAAPTLDAGTVAQPKIEAPITSPEFTQAIASRVSYLVDNNLNGATLQVTPPQLGPIELRVTIEAGHAQVSMSSHNPATLDALQAGAPKLRELLSAQGFGQVSVDVSQRSFQDGTPYSRSQTWTPASGSESATSSSPDAGVVATRSSLGMLDAYA